MAIGKLFDIVGDKIIPKADCFIIIPLKTVIEKYGKDGGKVIAFLHYMKSMRTDDNPYADVPLENRPEQIMYDLKLEIDLQSQDIKNALQCVEEKYYSTFYGLYRGIKAQMDRISEKLLSVEIDFGKDGNATNILRLMKDYESLRKSFKQAYRDFDEEAGGGRARGGGDLAEDEDHDY